MKKLIQLFSLILLLNYFSASFAQDIPENNESVQRVKVPKVTSENKATALSDTLNNALSLTPEQYINVYKENLKYVNGKSDIKSNSNGDLQMALKEIKFIAAERRKKIYAILNEEQKIKWTAWKKSRNLIQKNEVFINITDDLQPSILAIDFNGL